MFKENCYLVAHAIIVLHNHYHSDLIQRGKNSVLVGFYWRCEKLAAATCNCVYACTMWPLHTKPKTVYRKSTNLCNFVKLHCAFCRLTPVIGPVWGIANNDRNVLRNDTIRGNLGRAV